MPLFVKYINIYLPTGREVSKYPVHLPDILDKLTLPTTLLYDLKVFTLEQKKVRIRHKLLYVNIWTNQL
jgi:hypothetical protein